MYREWGFPEAGTVTPDEWRAIEHLRAWCGVDVAASPAFWERVVARFLAGRVTAHKCEHDVEVWHPSWRRRLNAEVKFADASTSWFSQEDAPRTVFKWAKPRGGAGKWTADVVILVGRDVDRRLFAWVIPTPAIRARCASITITAPSGRAFRRAGEWDRFAVPFDQLLPAFLRVCRG